jgi:GNAT superfamily N-acetyltransferase
MYYRLNKSDFREGKFEDGNRQAMKALVWAGKPTGILGIYEGEAVAWCAFAPRGDYLKLAKSRVHKPIDDLQVWSVPCMFIAKEFRNAGISVQILKGVVNYAREQKIKIVEAYPVIPTRERLPDSFAWTGLFKSFERAGFEIADRTSKNRPMVRCYTGV